MRKRLIVVGVVIAVLAALGYAYTSPYITVNRVRSAAERGDAETVNDHVDFPALRGSLKGSFNAFMAREMLKGKGFEGSSLLGMALGAKLADAMVDVMVTPQMVGAMMQGQRPKTAGPGSGQPTTTTGKSSDVETSMKYETWDRFVVTTVNKTKPDDKFTMVWRRDGLTWKLSALRLPMPE